MYLFYSLAFKHCLLGSDGFEKSNFLDAAAVNEHFKKSHYIDSTYTTASPRLSGWLGPEKVPINWKKIPVLDYRDSGNAMIY